MIKLLATLGLFLFLTSPASAGHYTLEHGKSYVAEIVSCASKTDTMFFIHAIQLESATSALSASTMRITAQNNNCVLQVQHFHYLKKDYVCGFTVNEPNEELNNLNVVYKNFTLLNIEVEGIKQYIVVYAPVSLDNIRPKQCVQERQPN